jgi:hypothetical protein
LDAEAKVGLGGGLAGGVAFLIVIVIGCFVLRSYWLKKQAGQEVPGLPEAPVQHSPCIPMMYELDAVDTVPAELPAYQDLILPAPASSSPGVSPLTRGVICPPSPSLLAAEHTPTEFSFSPGDDAHLMRK